MEENLTIKKWKTEERPREKFLAKGGEAMSVAELLSIILCCGTKNKNVVELARQILSLSGNNLHSLGKFGMEEYSKIRGIGKTKAITLMAMFELFRRIEVEVSPPITQIYSSESATKCIAPLLKDLSHEECWVLYLNRANKLLSKEKVSSGGTSATVFDIKIILKRAISNLASGIILVHNHPSGSNSPGEQDKIQTKRLKEAARSCDVSLLDHIIIAGNTYYSFADNGYL